MDYDHDELYSVEIRNDLIDRILEEIKDGTHLAPDLEVDGATPTEVAAHLRYMYKSRIIDRGVDKDPSDVPYVLNLSPKGERRASNLYSETSDENTSVSTEGFLPTPFYRAYWEHFGKVAAALTLVLLLLLLQFVFGIPILESVFGISV